VAALLSTLDIETLWEAAEDHERRVIIENMVESITVFPDRLRGSNIVALPPQFVLDQ
jgi:hypothetical protein